MGTADSGDRRPSRGAILLSSFVYPGVGQFVQRRWLAGLFFGAAFTTLFVLLMVACARIIIAYYRLGLNGEMPDGMPSVLPVLGCFGASLVVYLANVGDTYLAHKRAGRRNAVRRHFSPEVAAMLEKDETTGER
jgi:hypothetical protein